MELEVLSYLFGVAANNLGISVVAPFLACYFVISASPRMCSPYPGQKTQIAYKSQSGNAYVFCMPALFGKYVAPRPGAIQVVWQNRSAIDFCLEARGLASASLAHYTVCLVLLQLTWAKVSARLSRMLFSQQCLAQDVLPRTDGKNMHIA